MEKIKDRILIIFIIIISIFGITYTVYGKFFENAQSEYYSDPPWYGLSKEDGIIHHDGGDAKDADKQHDSGSLAVGVSSSGGGGNAGGGGTWNGSSADFKDVISSESSSFQPGPKGEIWFEDLCDIKEVLCSARGVPLTGKTEYLEDEKATGDYWAHDVDPNISPRTIKTYNLEEADAAIQKIASGDVDSEEYKSFYRTSCKYTGSDQICNPAEAFVLSEASRVSGSGEKDPLQMAWWDIHGMGEGETPLSQAAKSFAEYIEKVRGGEATTKKIGNTEYTGFAIEYNPQFVKTDEEAQVSFDSVNQKYIVGPFKIEYPDIKPFAFINNIDIYADNSSTPINKDKYYLASASGNELVNLNGAYPSNEQEFYIILDYDENIKKITDIQVDFQYMNASGKYTLYTGKYTWVYVKGHIFGEFNYHEYKRVVIATNWIEEQLKKGYAIKDEGSGIYYTEPGSSDELLKNKLKYWEEWADEFLDSGELTTRMIMSRTEYFIPDDWTYFNDENGVVLSNSGKKIHIWAHGWYRSYSKYVEIFQNLKDKLEAAQALGDSAAILEAQKELDTTVYDGHGYSEGRFNAYKERITHIPYPGTSTDLPFPLTFQVWKDLEYIKLGDFEAQAQAVSRGAARWWEYETIHWNQELPSNEEGKIKIVKETDGQAKNGDEFNFKVTVNNGNQTTTENLKIVYQEGTENSVESQVYTWAYGSTAPTYTVEEVNLPSNASLVSIENQSGSLNSGQTVTVKAKNKITENYGNLSISKQIESTKLDTNQYTLVGKIFKFNVTISGADCSFSYGGQNYTVTPEKSVTIPIQIESVADTASQEEKDAKSVKIANIKFYEDAPQYKVEEIIDETTPEGSAVQEIRQSEGYISKGATSEVIAINKYELKEDEEKASIGVIKTLDGDSNFSDEDLQKFEFKFRVKVFADSAHTIPFKNSAGEPYSEQIITAKASRSDSGTWEWRGQTDEYIWAYGNNPYYEIEEIDTCPVHGDMCNSAECEYYGTIVFDKEKTTTANTGKASVTEVTTDNKVKGQLESNEIVEAVYNVNITNSVTPPPHTPHKGKITINKEVTDDLLKNNNYEFTLKVTGTFDYKGQHFENQTIQLTNLATNINGYILLENEEAKDTQNYVTISVGNVNNASWTSDEFSWYGEVPKYTVEENLNGKSITDENGVVHEINSSVVPEEGTLADDKDSNGDGINEIIIKAVNSSNPPPPGKNPEDNAGRIRIIKEVENSNELSIDYLNSVKFKFEVKVEGYEKIEGSDEGSIVTLDKDDLKYNEKENKFYWEYISPKYIWEDDGNDETDDRPDYSITELESNMEDMYFVRAEGEDGSTVSGQTITGKLKDSGDAVDPESTEEIIITTDNTFVNKQGDDDYTGQLKIQKLLTSDGLDVKQFKFKITLSGKFYYDGDFKDGSYTFEIGGDSAEQLNDSGVWTSKEIKWNGEAPRYTVDEIESDKAELVSSENTTGVIEDNSISTATAVFVNKPDIVPHNDSGKLQITKTMTGNGISADELFEFRVTIQKDGEKASPFTIKIHAGETWTSDTVLWREGEPAPTYTVEEINIPEGSKFSSMTTTNGTVNGNVATGSLDGNTNVEINAINELEEKHGSFSVAKKVIFNKLINSALSQSFEVKIRISGTFAGNFDGQDVNIVNGTYELTKNLKDGEAYVSPELTWWGDNAPTITVEETQKEGWDRPDYSNNADTGVVLTEGERTIIVITNRIQIDLDLTMDLGGIVWEDIAQDPNGKNTKDSKPNGIVDGSEEGLDGVEVYVYRVASQNGREMKRELAVAHGNIYNSGMAYPVITSDGGKWKVTGLNVTGFTEAEKAAGYSSEAGWSIKYDVEFVYDGQTYEPTTLLSYDDGDKYSSATAETYANMNPSDRLKTFGNSSLALDYNRQEVNDRIREIYGKTVINGMGETIGTVNGSEGSKDVYYNASVPSSENSRVKSELQTTDESGIAYDLFKTKARTSVAGLQFPVDNYYRLEYVDADYTLNGIRQTYRAVYEHCLHINLGLVRRDDADIEVTKDLYSAKVVVDEKEIDYRFNQLADIINDANNKGYDRVEHIDSANVSYELGLYSTDYYYKAELYKSNAELYDNIVTYYKNLNNRTPENSEMEVYLTYKIRLYNSSSEKYVVGINSLDDYVESSLGTPISTSVTSVIDGVEKEVAKPSYLTSTEEGEKEQDVTWSLVESNIRGSDGATYNKLQTDLKDVRLTSGQTKYIYVTFAVQKDTYEGVKDVIGLGEKSNIVEVANYSTYYQDGTIAGKLDKDSAPSNINVRNHNDEKHWYEDDSDSAPVLNITLLQENRNISGIAWEDGKTEEGIRDNDEARIGGLTTELVEKIKLPTVDESGNPVYKEYDFLWPTNENLDCLGGKTLEYLTGFDSTTETSRERIEETVKDSEGNDVTKVTEVGQYSFEGMPTGDYVVRFLYGNDKTELEDTSGITLASATAYKENGERYSENEDINTANYDGDILGSTPAVYNGQDYKSTIYQKGFEDIAVDSNTGYLAKEYHDLTNKDLADANVSDAKDSEARRLEIMAESETITNENSVVLATATDLSEAHNDLFDDYSMFADTAKINLDIEADENLNGIQSEEIKGDYNSDVEIDTPSVNLKEKTTNYSVNKIDFGLIERPETNVVLDKQIKEIKLTTNDKEVIFDANYNITYETVPLSTDVSDMTVIGTVISETDEEMYLVAKIELDTESSKGIDQLQAMNKNEIKPVNAEHTGTQNFRYINVDSEILQGTTVEINYLISALNVGEVDYTSEQIEEITNQTDSAKIKADILALAENAKKDSQYYYSEDYVPTIGKYLGTTYYTGKNHVRTGGGTESKDVVVSSKVRQIIDYVDNDAVFTPEYNTSSNHMWRNTSINELTGNGYDSERLLDYLVIPEYEIVDDSNVSYITGQRNNLILSVDDQSEITDTINSNAGFESKLVPYNIYVDNQSSYQYKSEIGLTITKAVSAQDDADNLAYDNLTEIVKFENSVGRKDITVVTGNANPKFGEFTTALEERDSSATELITFTPPTGLTVEESMTTQVLVIVIVALGIIVTGIVIIKKKVLK